MDMNVLGIKPVLGVGIFCLLALTASGVRAETNAVSVAEGPSLSELRAENEALRKENQRLRRELVRQRGGEPVIDLTKVLEAREVEGADVNGKATDDGGFWLTTKSMRRHNSKCRYYKMGKGRSCGKDDGIPCKKCGG